MGGVERSVDQRLQRLEDLEDIRQLFVDYGHYLDIGDFASYGKLFADEGEILLGPVGRAKGPAQIQAMMEQNMAGRIGSSYHLIANPIIHLDGDRATTDVSWAVITRGPEGQSVLSMFGRHRDVIVRERGQWRFLRREGLIDIPSKYRG